MTFTVKLDPAIAVPLITKPSAFSVELIILSSATEEIVTPTTSLTLLLLLTPVLNAVFKVPANSFAEEETSVAVLKTVLASSEKTSSTSLIFLLTAFVFSIA